MFQVIVGSAPAARLLAPRASVLLAAVRGRKARGDPVAKSKQGRIKVPPPVDPREMLAMKERYSEYTLMLAALRLEFKEELLRKKYEEETGTRAGERAKQEAAEHRALMAWNEQENLCMLQARLLRVQKEEEEVQRRQEEATARREQGLQELIRQKEEEILQLQEDVKNFITPENLDQRIEQALDNPKNYNFAIDKEGRVVKQTALR
ncbi:28S ribosomal protein S26, mitochondrial [Cololabis saira]|uniref:28S ribosomal protein S26, mitochondrial n=1 Tax=Cololabis saira TaxID=129043 RepID=UPI002AD2DC9D|nr:28S ribosomal protein S26, mitochondrial [Cololabis saira]